MIVRKLLNKDIIKHFSLAIIIILLSFVCPVTTYGDTVFTNPTTGYSVTIQDEADLLSQEYESALAQEMQPITEYGNVAFVTILSNSYGSTASYAQIYNDAHSSGMPGTVFVIDMDNRQLYIDTVGTMRKRITSSYANTITDNIYTYATDGNYYLCASKAFSQIYTLLEGGRVAQPMKYASNVLLALVFALLINFLIVMGISSKHRPSRSQLMDGIYTKCVVNNPQIQFMNQTKTYSPQSSGSSGGSGGHSSGGGGGGHSGGGHSF